MPRVKREWCLETRFQGRLSFTFLALKIILGIVYRLASGCFSPFQNHSIRLSRRVMNLNYENKSNYIPMRGR